MDALLFSPRPRHASRAIASCRSALFFAERLFRWRGRNFRDATVAFIAARRTVPDRTPVGPDRRHCGRQPGGGGRLGLHATTVDAGSRGPSQTGDADNYVGLIRVKFSILNTVFKSIHERAVSCFCFHSGVAA
jgi:hypothetical protein